MTVTGVLVTVTGVVLFPRLGPPLRPGLCALARWLRVEARDGGGHAVGEHGLGHLEAAGEQGNQAAPRGR